MAQNQLLNGQSNKDKALQLYGTLDTLIKLANDSGVVDLSVEVPIYIYDPTSNIVNSANIGYPYATRYDIGKNICAIPTGLQILSSSDKSIVFRFNNDANAFYQYFYNTIDIAPLENQWIDTYSSIISILDINGGTTYYIFLRTKCNSNLFSPFIKISTGATIGDFNNDFNNDFN